jgi:hypothetical protein
MFLKRAFKTDRRRGRRQLINTSVRVFTEAACMEAIGINVSEHGMRLFAVANLPVHSQVQLEFLLPQSKQRLRVSGTVRNRALYLYGIEFSPDSEHQLSVCWAGTSTTTQERLSS